MKTVHYLSCVLAVTVLGFFFLGCKSNAFDSTCYKQEGRGIFDPEKCEEMTNESLLALVGPEYRIVENSETLPETKLIYIYKGEEKITGGYAHYVISKNNEKQIIFGVLNTTKQVVRDESGTWQKVGGYDDKVQQAKLAEDITLTALGDGYRFVSDGTIKYLCYKRWRVTSGYDSFWVAVERPSMKTDNAGSSSIIPAYTLYGNLGQISEPVHLNICSVCQDAPLCLDQTQGFPE